ncbi:MAG: M42 family metallopeptidase [Candidatus Cloacimonas sp.]|nr:M42 family metallopeptidase [Candidatus Cloacimonas sp.]
MNEKNKKYLFDLMEVASPSGYEAPAQAITKAFLHSCCDDISSDINGNLIAYKKGSGNYKVMIVGHADEIGFIISFIDDDGFLYVKTLGGFDVNLLPGLRVDIKHENKVVRGIIGKKPIHMMRGADDNAKLKIEDLWIDIGAKDKAEALTRVSIGDTITYSSHIEHLTDDLIVSKATDNKVGVYVAAAVMQELAKKKIKASYYAVASVGEETTMKGASTSAYRIQPDIAIVVDVTFTSDIPGADKKVYGEVSLAQGPTLTLGAAVHPAINSKLLELAKKCAIPVQIEIAPSRTGTDADAIHALRTGTATAVISIPNRYMHSPNEVISLSDLDKAVQLLVEFVKSVDDKLVLER